MRRNFTVYMHIFPNNKRYIGITCQKPEQRWRNGAGYGDDQPLIRNAIKKYGWENIEHIILFTKLSKEEACEKEKELIKKYNTLDDKYGYNMTVGGDGHLKYETEEEKEIVHKKLLEKQKKYYKENKEKCIERQKKYKDNNPEKIKKGQDDYYQKHREKILQYQKEYYKKNKEKVNKRGAEYVKKNKEKTQAYQQNYRNTHREELNKYFKEYYKNIRKKKKDGEHNGNSSESL